MRQDLGHSDARGNDRRKYYYYYYYYYYYVGKKNNVKRVIHNEYKREKTNPYPRLLQTTEASM